VVIKPFRAPHAQMNRAQAEEIWRQLRASISEIHNQNASSLSFEELYRKSYNLVLHKHGDFLYNRVCECEQEHLSKVAEEVVSTPDEVLLQKLAKVWSDHKSTMMMIRDILMYMDKTYVAQRKKMLIYDMGLVIFRDTIEKHPQVNDRLRNILLRSVQLEREGELVERMLMRNTLAMLVDLGIQDLKVYEQDFESHFLEATRVFYRTESLDYITQNTCPDYLAKAQERLAEEQARTRHYLNKSSEFKLKSLVEDELIARHARTLVDMENSGCISMLNNFRMKELAAMYDLFSRVPSTLDYLRQCVCDHVKKLGRELLADQERTKTPVEFVRRLLAMREKYEKIVNEAFRGEKRAQKLLKEAFEQFINADTRCASYLVLYIDELLKSSLKGLSEDETDAHLDRVIVIFRYLQDKDIFENFYKQHLSKRLLQGRSVSEDAERSMITKLKTECGYHFTSKLEGMFMDMNMSKDTMAEFSRSAFATDTHVASTAASLSSSELASTVQIDVTVLTAGYWPIPKVPLCALPAHVKARAEAFESFYLSVNSGRKLAWQTSMGSAEVKGHFKDRRHDLIVSTYQMCILMKFNEAKTVRFEEFAGLNIPEQELRRHLISLCTPKHRILKKASKGKTIATDDTFTFNEEYSCKMKRVKVPLVSAKETGATLVEGVPGTVAENRRHIVEASIVRIMKARNRMQHNELIAEVTRQLSNRFIPAPAYVKKRIESLIEREYLERAANDRRSYMFMA